MVNTWSQSENIRFLSILVLLAMYVFTSDSLMLLLAVSWVILIIIFGNVRHISYKNKITYTVRMHLYFLPYALPSIFFIDMYLELNIRILVYCMLAILIFCIWFAFNFKVFKISFNDKMIANTVLEPKYTLFLRGYILIGAAVCEELFFRGFILSLDAPIIMLIVMSSVYFMLSHYIVPWRKSNFTKKDYKNQLFFGFANSLLVVFSGSILPAILLHLLVNGISLFTVWRCFDRHYIRKHYFDCLLKESDSYHELEI